MIADTRISGARFQRHNHFSGFGSSNKLVGNCSKWYTSRKSGEMLQMTKFAWALAKFQQLPMFEIRKPCSHSFLVSKSCHDRRLDSIMKPTGSYHHTFQIIQNHPVPGENRFPVGSPWIESAQAEWSQTALGTGATWRDWWPHQLVKKMLSENWEK
jgi:hypothetical protein